MIYLPWVVFGLAMLWMIRQGNKAKQDYLRRKGEDELRKSWDRTVVNTRTAAPQITQGQAAELTGALAGERHTQITGFNRPQGRS